jgi:hypothetical protein
MGGRSGIRVLAGARYFSLHRNFHTVSGARQPSIQPEFDFFTRALSGRGMNFTTHRHLVPKLKISGAVPMLPLDTFMGWTGTTSHLHFRPKFSGDEILRARAQTLCTFWGRVPKLSVHFEGACPNSLYILRARAQTLCTFWGRVPKLSVHFEGTCPNSLYISKESFRVPMGIMKSRVLSLSLPQISNYCIIINKYYNYIINL